MQIFIASLNFTLLGSLYFNREKQETLDDYRKIWLSLKCHERAAYLNFIRKQRFMKIS